MVSGSGGEQADDAECGREAELAGADWCAQAKGDASSTTHLAKDYLVSDAIGKALQAHYRSLADAPLPDRFLFLLAELEAKDSDDGR